MFGEENERTNHALVSVKTNVMNRFLYRSTRKSHRTYLARTDRSFDQFGGESLELRSRDFGVRVLRSGGVHRDKGQRDVRLCQTVELALGLFGRLPESLHGELVPGQIDAALLFEIAAQILQKLLVEVLSAEHGVTVRVHVIRRFVELRENVLVHDGGRYN